MTQPASPPASPDPQHDRPRWAQGSPSGRAPELAIYDDANLTNFTYTLHVRAILGGLAFNRSASWATTVETLPTDLPDMTFHGRHGGGHEALLQPDGMSVALRLMDGRVSAMLAARTPDALEGKVRELRDVFPVAVPDPDAPQVPVTFWSLSPNGPIGRSRRIDVPPWPGIEANYAAMTRRALAPLMQDFTPGVGGQLLLWHGPPGTGKTYALRALGWEWRRWCSMHYITDPETFFGQHAAYMLDVLLTDLDEPDPVVAEVDPDDPDAPERPRPDPRAEGGRWRLLVLEDTGELMTADARERSGQGLSRLLNVVDGLIGQGLRILVLVTTNEEIRRLHPAIARPGRAASRVEFPALPVTDATEWLVERGLDEEDARTAVIAGGRNTVPLSDLFAVLDERETGVEREPQPAGFAA